MFSYPALYLMHALKQTAGETEALMLFSSCVYLQALLLSPFLLAFLADPTFGEKATHYIFYQLKITGMHQHPPKLWFTAESYTSQDK